MTWLYNARIVACFFVVLLHVSAIGVSFCPHASSCWWASNFYDSCSRWSVPTFVMISGALLLGGEPHESAKRFYSKRFARLLPPLIFWSAFYLMWRLYFHKEQLSSATLLSNVRAGSPYYHLWYLYILLPLYALTPLLRALVTRLRRSSLLALVAVGFIASALEALPWGLARRHEWPFVLEAARFVPYYLAGYLIRTQDSSGGWRMPLALCTFSTIAVGVSLEALLTVTSRNVALYAYDWLSLPVIIQSLSAMCLFKWLTRNLSTWVSSSYLASLTFGIYLIHPTIRCLLEELGYSAFRSPSIVIIPTLTIIIFLVSLLITAMVTKIPLLRRVV